MICDKNSIVFLPIPTNPRFRNLTDQVFERLTVQGLIARGSHNRPIWLCLCECGNTTRTTTSELVSGRTKSCGCYKRDNPSAKTHGMAGTLIYDIWVQMCGRCHNPNNKGFIYYGGKGVQVCDRWRHSFENFYADMGDRPNSTSTSTSRSEYSIERKNNKGHYEPDNCVWAVIEVQRNNQSNNHPMTFQGKTQTMAQWSRELHINYSTVRDRVSRGWSDEKTLTTPVKN